MRFLFCRKFNMQILQAPGRLASVFNIEGKLTNSFNISNMCSTYHHWLWSIWPLYMNVPAVYSWNVPVYFFGSLTCSWFWLQVHVFSTSCLSYQTPPVYLSLFAKIWISNSTWAHPPLGKTFDRCSLCLPDVAFHSGRHRAKTFSTCWLNKKRTQDEIQRYFFSLTFCWHM